MHPFFSTFTTKLACDLIEKDVTFKQNGTLTIVEEARSTGFNFTHSFEESWLHADFHGILINFFKADILVIHQRLDLRHLVTIIVTARLCAQLTLDSHKAALGSVAVITIHRQIESAQFVDCFLQQHHFFATITGTQNDSHLRLLQKN